MDTRLPHNTGTQGAKRRHGGGEDGSHGGEESAAKRSKLLSSSSKPTATSTSTSTQGKATQGKASQGKATQGKASSSSKKKKKSTPFPFGNYHGYYSARYRPIEGDVRVATIPARVIKGKRVLDIGCNAGGLTLALAQREESRPAWMMGVDLDSNLVCAARKAAKAAGVSRDGDGRVRFACLDVMALVHGRPVASQTLPDSWISRSRKTKTETLALSRAVTTDSKFDTVLAMSITKWIHIHHGDDGLLGFFSLVYSLLDGPGSMFVVEPQPWDSYWKRRKSLPGLRPILDSLALRPDAFADILVHLIGFSSCETLSLDEASDAVCDLPPGFRRHILIATV